MGAKEVLISGKSSFKIEVPYKLVETGAKGKKPLIVYLHGYNQNLVYFEKKMEEMLDVRAYHLFIQAPYPIYNKNRERTVAQWGRAWYLYDGRQDQFVKSMERASQFIQDTLDSVSGAIEINRYCIFGYSMGGYLGGYFAFSRWKYISDLIVVGGRIKTEVFEGKRARASHINVLALHGKKDDSVLAEPQKKEISLLAKEGFSAEFRVIDEGHRLTTEYVSEARQWLLQNGYFLVD
ncbi:MAG: hypothetical protein FH748_09945 [Balneolaceae bacterium]|nr:hypothetical protein [Balneolaceae bacterium]